MIETIVPSIPWWGWFHVIVSPNVGSFPVKNIKYLKKRKRKKGTIITIVPGIPRWGWFHIIMSPNMGSLPVKRVSIQKKKEKRAQLLQSCPAYLCGDSSTSL